MEILFPRIYFYLSKELIPLIFIPLPADNETESLGLLLRRIKEEMEKNFLNYKILLVDDGSTDRTGEIAKKCLINFV